jgi:hypothetical protein
MQGKITGSSWTAPGPELLSRCISHIIQSISLASSALTAPTKAVYLEDSNYLDPNFLGFHGISGRI